MDPVARQGRNGLGKRGGDRGVDVKGPGGNTGWGPPTFSFPYLLLPSISNSIMYAKFYCSKGFNVVIARAKITEDARRYPEQDAGAQRYATEVTVACERDQWGRAIVGTFYILACECGPRNLTTKQEVLLSATLIHEVMHVLEFDAHAFIHFTHKKKAGASVEDGGGRGTSGWLADLKEFKKCNEIYAKFSDDTTNVEVQQSNAHEAIPRLHRKLSDSLPFYYREEIQRIKANNQDISHMEALSAAAKNITWEMQDRVSLQSCTKHSGTSLDNESGTLETISNNSLFTLSEIDITLACGETTMSLLWQGFVGYKSVNLGTAASGYITVAQYVVESDVLSYDNPIRMLLPTHSIVVASPSSTLSDKSFLTNGGMHMMADTAAGNSKDPTELCQSVKKRLS
ncbi:leishmanolysin [Tanacetum coccineum]